MALLTSATVTFDYKGYTTTNEVVLGNKYENLARAITFSIPSTYSSKKKYFIASLYISGGSKIVILPVTNDTVTITKAITKYPGSWNCCVICRDTSLDFKEETIDIEPLLSEAQWVSSPFTGVVYDNGILKSTITNYTIEST